MNDITLLEPVAKKGSTGIEALWKPKAGDLELLSRLRTFLEEDRETKILIDAPTAGADCCSPVRAVVTWTRPAQAGSFQAGIDGQDVTGQFSVNEAAMRATALLDLKGDTSPTLKASVEMFRWLPQPGMRRMEASVTFNVKQPLWDLSVNSSVMINGLQVVDVFRGSTSAIRVVTKPRQCTTPELIVKAFTGMYASDQVAGIAFPNIPFTIAKGAGYGMLEVQVDATVAKGLQWSFIIASTAEDDQVGIASSFLGFYLNVV